MVRNMLHKLHSAKRSRAGDNTSHCFNGRTLIDSTHDRCSSTKGIDMQRKTVRNRVLTLGPAFILFGTLLLPAPAQAGFKWVEPPVKQAPPPAIDYPAVQVITGSDAATSVVTGDVQVIMAPDSMAINTPFSSVSTSAEAAVPYMAPTDVVQGFAENVPLSVALRQILPREVGFSVAQDVSLGTLVSWKGGASWREVLKTMLAPKKLTIKEDNGLVHVVHQTSKAVPAPVFAAQPLIQAPVRIQTKAPASRSMIRTTSVDVNVDRKPVALAPMTQMRAPVYMPPKPTMHPTYVRPQNTVKNLGFLPTATAAVPAQNRAAQTWVAHKGQMLRAVLMDWGRRANVDVSWQAEYDYPFQASVSAMGTFEDAARKLLAGFDDADPKPVGYLYNNQTAGQRVLVIQTRGNNYAE